MSFLIIVNLFEILSAIVGTYLIKKYRVDRITRYFVYFLWLTVFVELIFGWLPWFIYEIESLNKYQNTFLSNNHYAYNIYFAISFLFYGYYFLKNIFSKKSDFILKTILVSFGLFSILNLLLTDILFKGISPYIYIIGSLLIFIFAMIYFLEILQSDKILSIHKTLPFYIAVGAIVFHLVVTPLFIYAEYYNEENSYFVGVREIILYGANIFLYTCYTIGFMVCSKKNKSYL